MICAARPDEARQRGFTLAEVAVVVLIVGLLLGGLLGTYSNQIELSRISDTRRTLETARDALLGFAAANGRLPCPATAASNGAEQPAGGNCTVSVAPERQGVGFLPAATLGLTPIDSNGYLIDAWGSRVRYAVTNDNGNFTFTTQGQLRLQLTDLNPATPQTTLLRVCTTAVGIINPNSNTAACSALSTTLTNSAVAVIFSVGKNGVVGGTGVVGVGLDEKKNLQSPNSDRVFISHNPIPAPSANEFDDVVIWLSPSVLYNRILSGGL